MTPAFGYARPESLNEALDLLQRAGSSARVLAGGTDLMVAFRHGAAPPKLLVDVTRIPGLRACLQEEDGSLRVGAAVTHEEAAAHPLVQRLVPVLSRACASVGSVQVRNLGTVGGNAANAAVAADTLPALAALRARLEVAGPSGSRRLQVEDFFVGPNRTALQPGEILTAIVLPLEPPHRAAFLKVGRRRAAAISRLSVAAMVNPRTGLARIAVGAVFPTPRRILAAEEALRRGFGGGALEEAGRIAEEAVREISGNRPSMQYKLPVVRSAVVRAVRSALEAPEVLP